VNKRQIVITDSATRAKKRYPEAVIVEITDSAEHFDVTQDLLEAGSESAEGSAGDEPHSSPL
jgi:hypothetical protein